jgi:hypothetical protein
MQHSNSNLAAGSSNSSHDNGNRNSIVGQSNIVPVMAMKMSTATTKRDSDSHPVTNLHTNMDMNMNMDIQSHQQQHQQSQEGNKPQHHLAMNQTSPRNINDNTNDTHHNNNNSHSPSITLSFHDIRPHEENITASPALPISVAALTNDTPHLNYYSQQQPKQQPNQQQHPNQQQSTLGLPFAVPVVSTATQRIAAVPTSKLSSKSGISLPLAHFINTTSSSSSSSSPSSSSSSSPSPKRSSPDAVEQLEQVRKCSKIKSTETEDVNKKHQKQKASSSPLSLLSNIDLKTITLQEFFNKLLQSRGYSTNTYCSLETAYSNTPSSLQIASHGIKVIQAIRKSDLSTLQSLLQLGLSPNPCNKFGESIIHMICRRGSTNILKLFLDYGCNLQTCDDFGRTPLHDACWTSKPNFQLVNLILRFDRRLMNIVDCRGSSPLHYVKKEHWMDWMYYLDSVKDIFWKHRDVSIDGEECIPELVGKQPNSVPMVMTSLCEKAVVEEIALVAMGKVEPETLLSSRSINTSSRNVTTSSPTASPSSSTTTTTGVNNSSIIASIGA